MAAVNPKISSAGDRSERPGELPFRTNPHSDQHPARRELAPPSPSTFLAHPDLPPAEAKLLAKVRPMQGSLPPPQRQLPPIAAKGVGFPAPLFCFDFPPATVAPTLSRLAATPFECVLHPSAPLDFWPSLTKQELRSPKAKVMRLGQSTWVVGQSRPPFPPVVRAVGREPHTPVAWWKRGLVPSPLFYRRWALPRNRLLGLEEGPTRWSVERPKPWGASPRSSRTPSFLDRRKRTLLGAIETRRSELES